MTRWLVIVFAALALVVVGGPALLAKVPDARAKVTDLLDDDGRGGAQGASQLSPAEFATVPHGITPTRLRALVGEPEAARTARVEGLEVECLLYGIVGTSGAYQFCFTQGRLATKARFRRRA